MTATTQVLVVSPDATVRRAMERCAASLGCTTHPARSVAEARRALGRLRIDLVCLDSLLPEKDAERLWRDLAGGRRNASPGLLFVGPSSAKLVPAALPSFFRRRRDGLVTKPVDANEAERELARLLAANGAHRQKDRLLRAGTLALDDDTQSLLFADGGAVPLTRTEFRMLRYLMERPGQFVSPDELLEKAWGYSSGRGGPELVRAHVSNVRRKLRAVGQDAQVLRTLPYQGYGIVVERDDGRDGKRRARHSR